jgi:hypothetical protein
VWDGELLALCVVADREAQHVVELLCGIALHVRRDVTVKVKRDPDGRVFEALAHDFRVNALA